MTDRHEILQTLRAKIAGCRPFIGVAGACGTDPFRRIPKFLRQIKELGFSGVQNYQTVCLFEGDMRMSRFTKLPLRQGALA